MAMIVMRILMKLLEAISGTGDQVCRRPQPMHPPGSSQACTNGKILYRHSTGTYNRVVVMG